MGDPPRLSHDDEDSDIDRIEAWLKRRLGGDWLGWHMEDSGVPGTALWAQLTPDRNGRMVLTGLLLLGSKITADSLRKVGVTALENSTTLTVSSESRMRQELAALPPLERDGLAPEDFSQLVADHFKVWARYVPHPAAAMAAEWKVKSPTIHSWIREARLRGYLPESGRARD